MRADALQLEQLLRLRDARLRFHRLRLRRPVTARDESVVLDREVLFFLESNSARNHTLT